MGNEEKQKRAWLVINKQVIPLGDGTTTIGRSLENDIVIQDSIVSRKHAQISYEDGVFVLYDLNSTGGTYVNNKKVERVTLYPGDVVILTVVPFIYVEDEMELSAYSDQRTSTLDIEPLDDDTLF